MSLRMLLVAALVMGSRLSGAAGNDIAVAPGAPMDGKSQGEWSTRWWQWAASFERSESPVADRTGQFCHLKQAGPVWFLAGTYGTQRTIRTCKVPRGSYLFFPLINYVVFPREGEGCSPDCCARYEAIARKMTDGPVDLILELDGVPIDGLSPHRQISPACFDLGALAAPPHRIFPAAANGYYVMLKPLAPGKHVLNFGGRLPSLSQAVTYDLEVE